MSLTFTMHGFDALDKELAKFPLKVQRKIAVKALRKAAAPIAETMRARIPVRRGVLKKSVAIKVLPSKSKKLKVLIGPRVGKSSQYDGFHARFIEFGTKRIAPHPFARPAYDQHRESSVKILGEQLWLGLLQEIGRGG